MSRDWKHFLVKRFVHVVPWAISSPPQSEMSPL